MKYDGEFLKQLDNNNLKIVNVRITSYGMDDAPHEIIEGKIISGSINIDGQSSIRRSCSLGLIANNVKINDYYWCFNTRFNVEIGLDNNIDKSYPDIIWFNMGYYLITGFSVSSATSGYNISISGKDKMCLLNGELGGLFSSAVSFDIDEFKDQDGTITKTKIPIKTIIKNLIHYYGGEPYSKILINEVPDFGLELERYQGTESFYLLGQNGSYQIQATLNDEYLITLPTEEEGQTITKAYALKDIPPEKLYYNNELLSSAIKTNQRKQIYQIHKVEYGESCGYKIVDLIYPTDLIVAAGESITSILDKIKNLLGPYEYFYDLNGNFVFQKQQKFISNINYISDSYNSTDSTIFSYEGVNQNNQAFISYSFDNNNLVTNISNNPNHMNIKNDFSIWGKRKGVDNKDLPILFRYAIDNKPTHTYVTIDLSKPIELNGSTVTRARYLLEKYPEYFQLMNNENIDMAEKRLILEHKEHQYGLGTYDWRELIYQMAKDYLKFNRIDEFREWIEEPVLNQKWIIDGKTEYEQYYTDIEGFWRQIYKTEGEIVNIYSKLKEGIKYLLCTNDFSLVGNNIFLYDFSGPYYYNKNSEKVLIDKIYYGEIGTVQEINLETILRQNYLLLQKLFMSWVDYKNNEQSPIKKTLQPYYWKSNTEENTYEEIKESFFIQGTEINLESLYGKELFLLVDDEYLTQGIFQWPLKIKNDNDEYINLQELFTEKEQKINFSSTDSNIKFLSWLENISIKTSLNNSLNEQGSSNNNEDNDPPIEWSITGSDENDDPPIEWSITGGNGNNNSDDSDQNDNNNDKFLIAYWDNEYFPFTRDFSSEDNPYVEAFKGFNKSALKNPENLNFWFDLLDKENSEVSKYSVKNIGDRKKITSDDSVKSIYYLKTPDVIFDLGDYTQEQQNEYNQQNKLTGYAPINIPEQIKDNFIISTQGKSAYAVLENLLYNYTYCAEQINVNAIPVYYLQPNTIVNINDEETCINGNYAIQRLTYNLSSNSTMTIQCVKFIEDDRDREEYWSI